VYTNTMVTSDSISPLSWGDWDWCIAHLHRRKAGGIDGITYELVKDAPIALQQVIFDAVNAMLREEIIPRTMKGGMVLFLTKRELVSQLENLRPVMLLQTTYKLFTTVINNRLQQAMEELAILENLQEGFRPDKQTRQPIAKAQYVINEAKRKGGKLYMVYLDFFSAFCSVDIALLHLVLERLGMHQEDVDLIRNAHTGAWVKVHTPFGDTAEIQVTRGTPQGDALSPSLFVFFMNLCLRHLAGAGVGFVHK